MYLLIFEDGSLLTTKENTLDLLKSADNDQLSIVEIGSKFPTQYQDSEWYGILKADLSES